MLESQWLVLSTSGPIYRGSDCDYAITLAVAGPHHLLYVAPTRRDAELQLAEAGITGEAAKVILHAGAYQRAEDRETIARATVALHSDDPDAVGVVCWADCVGLGSTGQQSVRHPWLAKCGKGRRQATDGPAWSAAIRAVAQASGVWLHPDMPALAALPPEWRQALLRACLQRAAGVCRADLSGLPVDPSVPLAAWAAAYNATSVAPTEPAPSSGYTPPVVE